MALTSTDLLKIGELLKPIEERLTNVENKVDNLQNDVNILKDDVSGIHNFLSTEYVILQKRVEENTEDIKRFQ